MSGVAGSVSSNAGQFDRWIRTAFVDLNTELENLYFSHQDRGRVIGVGDDLETEPTRAVG
jgi:Domain of unknown function (DUF1864)